MTTIKTAYLLIMIINNSHGMHTTVTKYDDMATCEARQKFENEEFISFADTDYIKMECLKAQIN